MQSRNREQLLKAESLLVSVCDHRALALGLQAQRVTDAAVEPSGEAAAGSPSNRR